MSRRGQLSNAQINEIIDLYYKSVPISKISEMFRQGRPTIYKVLKLNEITLHDELVRYIPEEYADDIVELYQLGYSTNMICEYLGCPLSVITKYLDRAGVARRDLVESKALLRQIPIMVDTIDDEEWIAVATIPEIIAKMKELARSAK